MALQVGLRECSSSVYDEMSWHHLQVSCRKPNTPLHLLVIKGVGQWIYVLGILQVCIGSSMGMSLSTVSYSYILVSFPFEMDLWILRRRRRCGYDICLTVI